MHPPPLARLVTIWQRQNERIDGAGSFNIVSRFPIPKMERELTVLNKLGLHARPAAEFVRCARKFKSTVQILKDEGEYSAASILDVLSANLDCGSTMILRAEGSDAAQALDELSKLLHRFKKQEEAE